MMIEITTVTIGSIVGGEASVAIEPPFSADEMHRVGSLNTDHSDLEFGDDSTIFSIRHFSTELPNNTTLRAVRAGIALVDMLRDTRPNHVLKLRIDGELEDRSAGVVLGWLLDPTLSSGEEKRAPLVTQLAIRI